ncbi:MAG TPA: phage holin family protein [Tepidisphaeraceae bacterium]|jgi:hypothetical protein
MTDQPDVYIDRDPNNVVTGTEPMDAPGRERSIGELLKELRNESSVLVRQELALAKAEISEKATKAARNAAYIGAGAFLAYTALTFLLLAVTALLYVILRLMGAETHGLWIAPLIVGLVLGIVGYVLIQKGISTFKEQSLVPEKTTQSLKEDKQWLQDKVTQ